MASILFIIDPFDSLNPQKDSSMALMRAALENNHKVYVCQISDISMQNGNISICAKSIMFENTTITDLTDQIFVATYFDMIFMRKDPPVDKSYIYCTYLLSFAASQGVRILNPPSKLRDFNEKLLAFNFPNLVPEYCLSSSYSKLKSFSKNYEKIILKPIDGMGGKGVFLTHHNDPNFSVIVETLTEYGKFPILAQRFIPQIEEGDKRILILNEKIFDYSLARIPSKGNIRGNLAVGGTYEIKELSTRDREIANDVSRFLTEHNISICGIDVIGDYLTEINITSPTCLVELSSLSGINIADDFIKNLI